MTLSTLALLRGRTLAREGGRLLVKPAPSPEEARALAPLKRPLLALIEEGGTIQGDDLLADLHLLAALLAAKEGIPPMAWLTCYYQGRYEPERALVPGPNLIPHLRWRARNLPEPRRVHLAATDGRLILDLEARKGELSPGLLAVLAEAGERWGLPGALAPLEKTQEALGGSPRPCA